MYLGRDIEDYKPFLRVGTAHGLPEEVRPLVYSIVVTDLLPGSPLLEQQNLPPGYGEDFRYIGDPDTVERMKTYLHHAEIPSIGYEEAHEELEEQGAYAYFYDDGNLRLKIDKNEIFNLKRREEQDLHYPERARQIKKLFQGSRTKYAVRDYGSAGLFVVGGVAYLFSRGRVAALGTDEAYFSAMAGCGIDPDRVSAVVASEPGEGLVRLIKRTRGSSPLRIVTEHSESVRPIAELFAGDGKLALKYEISRLGTDKFIPLLDYRIRTREKAYEVERSDSGLTLHIGEKTPADGGLHINPSKRAWRFSQSGASGKGPLLEGVLYRFYEEPPPQVSQLIADYLPGTTTGSRSDVLSAGEDAAAGALTEFFRQASAGSDAQSAAKNVRSALDNVEGEFSALFLVYLENARAVAEVLSARDEARKKSYRQLLSALPKPHTPPLSSRFLPLVGEFYVPGDGSAVVLYRVTDMVTADNVAFAEELVGRYEEVMNPFDPDVFASEHDRLYELLANLDLVKARIPKHERTEEREREEAARQARGGGAKSPAEPKEGAGKRSHDRRSRKARRTRTRRTIAGIAAALLVLLLLGAGYLIYGPGRDEIAQETGVQQDGGAQEEQAESDAQPGTGSDSESGSEAEPAAGDEEPGTEADSAQDADEIADSAAAEQSDNEQSEEMSEAEEAELLEGIPGLEPRESVGGIVVTILDIISMANRIAEDNGYRPMGAPEDVGPNPDWIFPGNEFVLPDGSTRTVAEGDTIWDIAADFIEKRLAVRYERYLEIVADYEEGNYSDRGALVERLVSLRDSTYAENFESLVQQTIEEVRQGE
ncbi:MAG: hypothetical protein ACQETQ_00910 [Spirochaetota bacterium]